MPEVSVIIPVYGVEKYIERCARSLFEQTLEDMEFIFVDDCTNDMSIEVLNSIISEYPNRKSQIKILRHEVNLGLSQARKTGVSAANGRYIAHCDSDDWVEFNMYELLYEKAVAADLDFVKSGFFLTDGVDKTEYTVYTENNDLSKVNVIRYLLLEKRWNNIWNILVNRKVYADVIYTENAMLEDYYVVTQLLLESDSIGVVNRAFYNYYQHPNSICGVSDFDSVIKKSRQAEKNCNDILEFIHRKYGSIFRKEEVSLRFIPRRILIPIMNSFKNYKYWFSTTHASCFSIVTSRYISKKHKLWYLSVLFMIRPIIKQYNSLKKCIF